LETLNRLATRLKVLLNQGFSTWYAWETKHKDWTIVLADLATGRREGVFQSGMETAVCLMVEDSNIPLFDLRPDSFFNRALAEARLPNKDSSSNTPKLDAFANAYPLLSIQSNHKVLVISYGSECNSFARLSQFLADALKFIDQTMREPVSESDSATSVAWDQFEMAPFRRLLVEPAFLAMQALDVERLREFASQPPPRNIPEVLRARFSPSQFLHIGAIALIGMGGISLFGSVIQYLADRQAGGPTQGQMPWYGFLIIAFVCWFFAGIDEWLNLRWHRLPLRLLESGISVSGLIEQVKPHVLLQGNALITVRFPDDAVNPVATLKLQSGNVRMAISLAEKKQQVYVLRDSEKSDSILIPELLAVYDQTFGPPKVSV
jgi:hypothetical protein